MTRLSPLCSPTCTKEFNTQVAEVQSHPSRTHFFTFPIKYAELVAELALFQIDYLCRARNIALFFKCLIVKLYTQVIIHQVHPETLQLEQRDGLVDALCDVFQRAKLYHIQ